MHAYLSTTVMAEVLYFKLPVKVALLRHKQWRGTHICSTQMNLPVTLIYKSLTELDCQVPKIPLVLSVDERGIKHREILNSALFYLSNLFKPRLSSTEFLMKNCRSRIQTEGHGVTRTFFNKWLQIRM